MKNISEFPDRVGSGPNFMVNLTDTAGIGSDSQSNHGRRLLQKWLHSSMKIEMTDGRTLVGSFMCTDRDNNIILGSCIEHLQPDEGGREEEPRVLGLAMVPGRHIVSICVDEALHPQHPPPLYT